MSGRDYNICRGSTDEGLCSKTFHRLLLALACVLAGRALHAADDVVEIEKRVNILKEQGRYPEAEKLCFEMIEVAKRSGNPISLAAAYTDMATLYLEIDRWRDAEPFCRDSLKIFEEKLGPDHDLTADALTNLAELYRREQRLRESERYFRRALAIREKRFEPQHEEVSAGVANLATILDDQGRFAEAEPLHQRALNLRRQRFGDNHPLVARSYYNLGHFFMNQNRLPEARWHLQESLRRHQTRPGGLHPDAYQVLSTLGSVCADMGLLNDAEKYYLQANEVARKTVGPDHPRLHSPGGLAELYTRMGRYDEADALFKNIVAYNEQTYGRESAFLALALSEQASLFSLQQRHPEALANRDRAIAIYNQFDNGPHRLMASYLLRGKVHWQAGHRDAALADIKRAIDFAEAKRATLSGGERERAAATAEMQSNVYRSAAAIYLECGMLDDALAAIEAGRSRALLEQMLVAHVDLLSGVPPAEAKRLRDQEESARYQLTLLENEFDRSFGSKDLNAEEKSTQRKDLQDQLSTARRQVVDAYAAIRTASPVYHRVLGDSFSPASLNQLQQYAADHEALVLYYSVGETSSWMIAIDGRGGEPRVSRCKLSDDQQRILGIHGPELKLSSLEKLLMNETDNGVLQLLSNPRTGGQATDKLRALYDVLAPDSEQTLIRDEKVKRLIIIPDGPLALFPFEALVTEAAADPTYLIDVAPPIHYAPSATILLNLADRKIVPAPAAREPVLALGDPAYGAPASQATVNRAPNFASLGSRYAGLGGALDRLPYSGQEAGWVATNFRKQGISVSLLRQADATEGALRAQAPGRKILHLACHGLTDQSYGNFFGALALAPGRVNTVNPADDGFLTLAETYGLDLRCCELAILSACQTNYGPHQEGEGVWALTRGFLVAGSRRVIASNWLVDDEAAASLVSYDCGILAKQEHNGQTPDYALALRDAKRWVRSQPKWRDPYYWSTFVLIGPN